MCFNHRRCQGEQKKVTVYFNNDEPEEIDFKIFKSRYTIDPAEAKRLEQEKKLAFPHVSHAIVEYPLTLLEKGIEIVDSPGLNDTEARNSLSLGYVYSCQAILFVMRATQPFTLEEKRYLDNYIKDRGLSVFFLINGWDELANELIDPEDTEELAATEVKSRQYFKAKLAEYIPSDTNYESRVFEISALNALRSRLKDDGNLATTGYAKLTETLNGFLTEERAIAEFNLVKTLAEQTYNRVREIVARRIPSLSQTEAQLKAKVAEIEPELTQLDDLRDRLIAEIEAQRDLKATAIANSFEDYVLKMEDTFEVDFYRYEPELYSFNFIIPSKRDEFYDKFKKSFDKYITDALANWEKEASKDLEQGFTDVLTITKKYSEAYEEISESLNTKLIGRKIIYLKGDNHKKEVYRWKNWTIGCLALASGNVAGVALAGAGFSWKSVLINWLSVFGISRFLMLFTSMVLTPYAALGLGLGVAGIQVGVARQNFMKYISDEFRKYLPKIAKEQKEVIKETVNSCFDRYQRELIKRIDCDLQSHKTEIDNLIKKQSTGTDDGNLEVIELQNLDAKVLAAYQKIESLVNN